MPQRYAVIGHPIAHSRSPQIHTAFAAQTAQDMSYERILAPLDGFAATLERFMSEGGAGCNVTQPFKLEAYRLAQTRAPRAELAGAVNTLIRAGDAWHGDNTDGWGLVRDLTRNHDVALAGRSVLVLGAGGASRGVLGPLLDERPERLVVANRTLARAEALVEAFERLGRIEAVASDALAGKFDVVINATSAELSGGEPEWPAALFAADAFAYDMVYSDTPTRFLRWARDAGAARGSDGIGMLIEQAAESFFLWRGIRPDTAPLFDALRAGVRLGSGSNLTPT